MKKALYCGSFDPITLGHLDIIARAAKVFDVVTVGVGVNPSKKYMFTFDERVRLIKDAVEALNIRGVEVEKRPIQNLTADYANINGYKYLIKGARTNQDFDYERLIQEVSLTQQRHLETILLFSSTHLSHVSSSAVKELARFHGLIHEYVPLNVKCAIENKLDQKILGVTGTAGSGKSTLCKRLVEYSKNLERDDEWTERRSVHHVNLDEVGHELFTSDLPIAVETRSKIFDNFRTENRKEIGDIVFGNPDKLKVLNDIFRDPMLTLLRDKMSGLKGTILLEGALLAEMNWLFLCNNNVVILKTPSEELHQKRLSDRGMTPEQIKRRLDSQYTFEEKMSTITKKIDEVNFGSYLIVDSTEANTKYLYDCVSMG